MKYLRHWLTLSSFAALLQSCSKPEIEFNVPNIDWTTPYTWPVFTFDESLTSDKTFKMIVREYGTGIPVNGAKLVFVSNGNRTDSLSSNAAGEILITGRDVGATKCLVSGDQYWAHGTPQPYMGTVTRLDSIYRTPTVDSVVTYLFPLSWIRVSVKSLSPYPVNSYHETKIWQACNGFWTPAFFATLVNPAQDTTRYFPVYGNDTVKVAVELTKGINDFKFIESGQRLTGRGDTTNIEMTFD